MNHLRAVIFDLDGTLVSSELDFNAIRREIGNIEGPILEHLQHAEPHEQTRAGAILERHEREAANRCQLTPGAAELLDFLRARNVRLGLLTRNSRASADAVCRRHRLLFDVVVARDDAPPKPSPAPVRLACDKLGVTPRQTLVVGDYRYDIEAGRAAGAWTALLCDRAQPPCPVEADFEIESLSELREIVALLGEKKEAI